MGGHLLGRGDYYRAANIHILQSGRFSLPIRKIFYITYNLMDKKFPESGRLSNLCTWIGLFSLKIRKSSAEPGRVGSPVIMKNTVSTSCRISSVRGNIQTQLVLFSSLKYLNKFTDLIFFQIEISKQHCPVPDPFTINSAILPLQTIALIF